MSANVIFAILASIIIIAVVIYLIAVKKGRAKETAPAPEEPEETEEDKEEL